MVSIRASDEVVRTLTKGGRSGGIPFNSGDLSRAVEELSHQVANIKDALLAILRHQRAGPDWEVSFEIRYDEVDGSNQVTVNHNLGHTPLNFVVVLVAVDTGSPDTDYGTVRMVSADSTHATFRFDAIAITNKSIFTVIPFRGGFVPTADTAPGMAFALGNAPEHQDSPLEGMTLF